MLRHDGGTPAGYAWRVNPKRRDVTFLVRMWLTEGSDGDAHWRGSVHEVTSGKRLFVTETRDVADFIAARLADAQAQKV
ncbi:MAG TPA: hypothetical protein VFE16_09335 [Candidatus Cybelea sp.]|nr:hypothetical protein [Candidatus Cybelea sp.]